MNYADAYLSKETKVCMIDGSQKKIEDIRIGDYVQGLKSGHLVENIFKGRENNLICIRTNDYNIVRATKEQAILTVDGWKKAVDISSGDILVCQAESVFEVNDQTKVVNVCEQDYGDIAFGLVLKCKDDEASFLANGIVVGDLHKVI